jgi:hypothetical protein
MSPVLPITTTDGLNLDRALARRIGEELSSDYCFADPFPHIVIDNFLPLDVARRAQQGFPESALPSDTVFNIGYAGQNKRQILPADCSDSARGLFAFLNSQPFLEFLEGLSSMQALLPDPYFEGGGYHETTRGGKLGIHADFRINERLHLHRRMNVIIYLNEGWHEEYGGHLELWDRKMSAPVKKVAPEFNRCVIFNTDADSYHGHPDPLQCPPEVSRRSIALYYYTASRAIYKEVPADGTVYKARSTDSADVRRQAFSLSTDDFLRAWTPPALARYAFAIKRRLMK